MLDYPSVPMELLLNLIWLTLGMGAFFTFMRCRPQSKLSRLPYKRALLALACALLLLFPVVSASDDLHPGQALMEDASKRIQHFASWLQVSHNSVIPMLPLLLALFLLFGFTEWQPWQSIDSKSCALDGYRLFARGRAPPSFST